MHYNFIIFKKTMQIEVIDIKKKKKENTNYKNELREIQNEIQIE